MVMLLVLALPALSQDVSSEVTLIKNVNIFDGKNEKLLEGYDVLVVHNLIKPGAYADLIIIDKNPLEDISLLANPD